MHAKKTKKLIVGNWKMNPLSIDEAKEIVTSTKRAVQKATRTHVVLCPPTVFISDVVKTTFHTPRLSVGGQDAFWESYGSYTGSVSPMMLASVGAGYVILGHSERRALGETELQISAKILLALEAGLTVIVCVGESVRDDHGRYLEVIRQQITSAFIKVTVKQLPNVVVAYEPIWAIGKESKGPMTPRDLHEMTIFIKKVLSERYSQKVAMQTVILYGGSVTADTAATLVKEGEVSGLLVGRESINPEGFSNIIKVVDAL